MSHTDLIVRITLAGSQAQVRELRAALGHALTCRECGEGDGCDFVRAALARESGEEALREFESKIIESNGKTSRCLADARWLDELHDSRDVPEPLTSEQIRKALREFGRRCINKATGLHDDFRCVESEAVIDAVLKGAS